MVRIALLALVLAMAGCTVKPLYSDAPGLASGGAGSEGTVEKLAAISISQPRTREEQEVRNHLIFFFGSGQGEPRQPRYVLELSVPAIANTIGSSETPTAGTITLVGSYAVREIATSRVVVTGSHTVSAGFNVTGSSFATSRAQRDAANRAARELAEFIRLGVATKI